MDDLDKWQWVDEDPIEKLIRPTEARIEVEARIEPDPPELSFEARLVALEEAAAGLFADFDLVDPWR